MHTHLHLHYESCRRMDKCDIMAGGKCDKVARWSAKWRYTFRPICAGRGNGWTDVPRVVSRPARKTVCEEERRTEQEEYVCECILGCVCACHKHWYTVLQCLSLFCCLFFKHPDFTPYTHSLFIVSFSCVQLYPVYTLLWDAFWLYF